MPIAFEDTTPGSYSYQSIEAVRLPTGGADSFPIIIARGKQAGPTLWLTATIHGNEPTGLAVLHKLLTDDLPQQLRGTLVAVPTLNPAGLRERRRSSTYLGSTDPNRLFPAPGNGVEGVEGDGVPDNIVEAAYLRLFKVIEKSADYLIDLHCMSIDSIPLSFRDPVYYFDETDDAAEAEAQQLDQRYIAMMAAFGFPIINEFASDDYINKNLHRSVAGSVLNRARKPAFTVELGRYRAVDPVARDAAIAGTRNVMRWAGMLDGEMEAVSGFPTIEANGPVRRIQHPKAPESGVVHHRVQPGQRVEAGQAVADICDIYGRPLGEHGVITSEHDGYVIALYEGVTFFKGEHIMSLAVADDSEMIRPYPTSTQSELAS